MKAILEADEIRLNYGHRTILSGAHIRFAQGSITGLLGRNGSGKSTLMQMIYGTIAGEKSVRINGIAMNKPFLNKGLISYMPQSGFIPKNLKIKTVFSDYDVDLKTFEDRFSAWAGLGNQRTKILSGSDRKFLEVYIILFSKSDFVFLDEPFTHLSPLQVENVKSLIIEQKQIKSVTVTDHLYDHILDICDPVFVLLNGKLYPARDIQDLEKLGYLIS